MTGEKTMDRSASRIADSLRENLSGLYATDALCARIRERTLALLGGYVASDRVSKEGIASYIVPPALGVNSGVTGALLLGARAFELGRESIL